MATPELIPSEAYEASHVLKASPGHLLHLSGYNSKGSTQFIHVYDAAEVPPDSVAGVAEQFTLDFNTKTAAGLAGKYMTAEDADGPVIIWFDLDNGSTAPVVTGRKIEVDIATGDTDTQMADKYKVKVDADSKFSATILSKVVTVVNSELGVRTNATAGNSTITTTTTVAGVDTALVIPKMVFVAPASGNFAFQIAVTVNESVDRYSGIPFTTGIVVCNSSTGPVKTIGSADCFFTALVR